ncbi:MAG: hypothetical protein CM15mP125_0870 [Gammaproteobacteria bacterium]|nr:MAG: hypothetical protein CM15mP125_0870 [Gammaproteobacteria bacterium]
MLTNHEQLGEKVARLAPSNSSLAGGEKGVHVGLLMENTPAYLEVLFACWHAGCVAVPINSKLHPESAHILLSPRVCCVFCDRGRAEQIESHRPASLSYVIDVESAFKSICGNASESRDPGDPQDFYTSGTRARKGNPNP